MLRCPSDLIKPALVILVKIRDSVSGTAPSRLDSCPLDIPRLKFIGPLMSIAQIKKIGGQSARHLF
jgi:hypothetical protein